MNWKKIYLVLLCLPLLAACAPSGSTPFDPAKSTQALLSSGAFSEELEELEPEIAHLMFTFSDWSEPELTQDSIVYCSTGATAELCAVIVVGDGNDGDMSAARECLERWIANQLEAESDYRPAEAEKLGHAILEERENTLLLVVAADWEAAETALGTL